MRSLIKVAGAATIAMLMLTSCIVHEHHGRRGLPPGQAKKVYIYKNPGHGHGHYKHRGHGHGRHR
ncbi:hypothetical protein [Chryseobacterium daeguense]|uniref:hypothetical protein n=1 Tax=Chryseobacterium daeguense TaxID=412438 RepID=UPI00041781EE|nr:hypothetical protein [Chryseobacterium daeguense]